MDEFTNKLAELLDEAYDDLRQRAFPDTDWMHIAQMALAEYELKKSKAKQDEPKPTPRTSPRKPSAKSKRVAR